MELETGYGYSPDISEKASNLAARLAQRSIVGFGPFVNVPGADPSEPPVLSAESVV
jgi:hypothetical protein